MKHIKDIELFEAIRKPRISDFFFDTYIHSICEKSKILEAKEYPEGQGSWFSYLSKKFFLIEIVFKNASSLYNDDDILKLLEIYKSLKPFCIDSGKSKKSDAVNLTFNFDRVILRMVLTKDKIEEIKLTDVYKNWLVGAELKWNKYKEEQLFKKTTRKYNL